MPMADCPGSGSAHRGAEALPTWWIGPALAIVETMSGRAGGAVAERMRVFVRFHAFSVARKGSQAGDAHM
jgi:hypothetical protein